MSEIRVDTISEKTSANGVAVDGVTLKDGAITSTAASTITTADNNPQLTLVSTDADGASGPNLTLYRNSSSPADNDQCGRIKFIGRNDNSQDFDASYFTVSSVDVSDGSEDASMEWYVKTAGSDQLKISMKPTETVFNEASADLDFRVESNGSANMLFIDAGNDHVNIGTSTDLGGVLNVEGQTVIRTSDNSDTLTLKSTDDDAGAGPVLNMVRDSASPADGDGIARIYFTADNDAGEAENFVRIKASIIDASNGSEDGQLRISRMIGGGDQNVLSFLDTETVVNDDSKDLDFRVESNGNTHMLFVDGGNNRVGIGTTPDLGAGLHIRTADSGASSNNDADELVLEQNGACGISILSANNSQGNIFFGDDGDNDIGRIIYNHNNNRMSFRASALEFLSADSSRKLSTGGEDTPDCEAGGLTLDINANDGNTLSFKSSDIAHGITGTAETDTFCFLRKHSATNGGISITALSEATETIKLNANPTTVDTTKSTSGVGTHIIAVSKNGNAAAGTDANLLVVNNHTTTQFIFDAEGTFHSNVGTATYDAYDDAHLVRAMDLSTSTKGLIASKFDDFIQYNHEDLANAKIVGREKDGMPNSMVNWTAMSQLHNGAIWQQYEKHQRLAEAVYEMAKEALGEDKADAILKKHDIKLLN